MTLSIRRTTYQGQAGFLVCGKREPGYVGVNVFCRTRTVAEHVKAKLLKGEDLTLEDLYGKGATAAAPQV